jgi:hypothetical protein
MADTIEILNAKISAASAVVSSLRRKMSGWAVKRDALLTERNKSNFGNIEWLINNPNSPGQYEAMRAWVVDRFGGEWMGVSPSGYYPQINQQSFSIILLDRWRESDKADDSAQMVSNVKAFLDECLQFLKPNADGFVSFTYATGSHSGIFCLAFEPKAETWWTTNTRYGRMVSKAQHADLDAAIAAAQAIAVGVDD